MSILMAFVIRYCTSTHCSHLESINNVTGYNGLYMIFFYSDDGTHFKDNNIPHKMTCGLVSFEGWPLIKVKNNKDRRT